MDGARLDMSGLVESFQQYWLENSEILIKKNVVYSSLNESIKITLQKYGISNETDNMTCDIIKIITNNLRNLVDEALTHLVLYAFLQRVLNGGADFVQREYALGRARVDICVSYQGRRYPLELKIKGNLSLKKAWPRFTNTWTNVAPRRVGWWFLIGTLRSPGQRKNPGKLKFIKA
jgi:hypothetical protein